MALAASSPASRLSIFELRVPFEKWIESTNQRKRENAMFEKHVREKRGRFRAPLGGKALLALCSLFIMGVPSETLAQEVSCPVEVNVDDTINDISALQFEVDYSGAPAGGIGVGSCVFPAGTADANIDNGAGLANLGWSNFAPLFDGPGVFVTCTYVSTSGVEPLVGDFGLTLIDASQGIAPPTPISPNLSVTVGACAPSAATCGNAVLETGEQCDDGNLDDGDGCSSACRLSGSCPATPCSSTHTSEAGKGQAKLKDGDVKKDAGNAKDQAQAKFKKLTTELTGAEVGDPSTTTDYSWCMYDDDGLLVGGDIAAGDAGWSCKLDKPGKEQCKYKSKAGNAFGISGSKVKAGAAGKGQADIKVKAKAGTFASPEMPLAETGPATVTLSNSEGTCISLTLSTPFKKNDGAKGQFQDKND